MDIISLGIGDPDLPSRRASSRPCTPRPKNLRNLSISSYTGLFAFRKAVSDWYKARFGVDLDPKTRW
jgi:LL-diaminopimelate aminotransferase